MKMNIAVNQDTMRTAAVAQMEQGGSESAFAMREKEGYFRHTSRNEAVIRFVGIVIILGAFVQWLTPNANFAGNADMTKMGLSIAFSIIGIALYTHATRGHRIEVAFDPARQDICIARLDRRDGVRSTRRISLRDIKSIYVMKSEGSGAPSKMRIKLYASPNEVTAVRGTYEEIEMAHRQLCRNIRLAQS